MPHLPRFFSVQQNAVADTGRFAGPRLARNVDADLRCWPVRLFVPFVGAAIRSPSLSRDTIGEHGRGQGAGMVQLLAFLLDGAFVTEFAQQAFELGTHGVLEAKGAGDFAGADFAFLIGDEGENVGLGGEGGCFF